MPEWVIPDDIGHPRAIGALLPWLEFVLEPYGGGSTQTYRWSDVPISLPTQFIEPRLLEWVRLIRALADDYGNIENSQFGWIAADHDRTLLALADDVNYKYWANRLATLYVIDSNGVSGGYDPFVAARGVVRAVEVAGKRRLQFTADDFLASEFSASYLDEELPRRLIESTRFLDTAYAVNGWNTAVDGMPEPIIYGEVSDQDLAAGDRRGAVPCYPVGCESIAGNQNWVRLLVAGHAVKSIDAVYFNGTLLTPGTDVYAPGFVNWPFGTTYRDIGGRRYTIIYALGPNATEAVAGTGTFTVDVKGIETVGDGSGTLIEAVYDQYLHWLKQFGFQNYLTGAWLSAPLMSNGTPRIDDASFSSAKLSIATRGGTLPGNQGYYGAGVLGNNGEKLRKRDIIYRFNSSCDSRSGFNRNGQFMVVSGEPKTKTLLYTESSDIFDGSFHTQTRQNELRNVIPYSFRKNYISGAWMTENRRVLSGPSISAYKQRLTDNTRELHFTRRSTTAEDIALHFLHRKMHPPRRVIFSTGLKGLKAELGDNIGVTHRDGPGGSGWTDRSTMVERVEWNPRTGQVDITAWDYGVMETYPMTYSVEEGKSSAAGGSLTLGVGGAGGGGTVTIITLTNPGSTRLYLGGSHGVLMQTSAGVFKRHPEKVDVILDSTTAPTKWIVNVHVWTKNASYSVTPRIVAGSGDDGTGEFLTKTQVGLGVASTSLVPAWQPIEVTTLSGTWAYRLELMCSAANNWVGGANAVGGW